MVPNQIETSRLLLSPFGLEDLAIFHQLNVDPYVRAYLWDDEAISLETATDILSQNERHFAQDRYGLWKVELKTTADLIGYTGLWFFFDEPQPQLLYALFEKHSGKGYATESAQAVVDYAFSSLDFSYLIAAMDEPHLASQKVARRLGMALAERRIEEGKATLFYRIEK